MHSPNSEGIIQNLGGPLEKLQKLTDQELERLKQQRNTMESVHSNLDLLIKRYNLKQSYIGQITNWYGSLHWLVKIFLFLLTAGIGACIGILCHIPIILGVCAGVIYILFAFFFINHYQVTQKQTNLLCEDIIELEKSLGTTIEHFNELSCSLKGIFNNLYQMNKRMLDDIQQLEDNIKEISTKLNEYKQIIAQLSTAKESLTDTTTKISKELTTSSVHLQECYQIITEGADSIIKINHHATITNISLLKDGESIKKLAEKYHLATLQIEKTAKKMEGLFAIIHEKITSIHKNQAISNILNQSDELITTTQALITDTTATIQKYHDDNSQEKSSQVIEKARLARIESASIRKRVSHLINDSDKKKNPSDMYRFLC